jgi:hypothetical protein
LRSVVPAPEPVKPPGPVAIGSLLTDDCASNLTRFHGVFAPNREYRARVTPARRGGGGQHAGISDPEEPTPAEPRAEISLTAAHQQQQAVRAKRPGAWTPTVSA